MHPGAWLAWAAAGGLVAISTTNPFYLLPLAGAAWVVHAIHGRPGPAERTFRVVVAFALVALVMRTGLIVFGRIDAPSFIAAALEGLRLATMLVIFAVFNSVSDPHRLLALAPRRFNEPALAAALALTIAPRIIDAGASVMEAQRLRGIHVRRWRNLPALAVPVLETGMEGALALAESMDARGHGRGPRSHYRRARWERRAIASASVSGIAVIVFFVATRTGTGDLIVSTWPLAWPDASWALVATASAFAIPAFFRAGTARA